MNNNIFVISCQDVNLYLSWTINLFTKIIDSYYNCIVEYLSLFKSWFL